MSDLGSPMDSRAPSATEHRAAREQHPCPASHEPSVCASNNADEGSDAMLMHPAAARERLAATITERLDGLYRFVFHRVGCDSKAAEDITQEAVCIAWAKDSSPAEPDDQERWMRGIARNLVKRHWRLHPAMAQRIAKMERVGREMAHRLTDGSQGASQVRDEEMDRLMLALTSLTHDEQELILRFYKAGLSHENMACERGGSAKAIESALYRARKRLREALLSSEDES